MMHDVLWVEDSADDVLLLELSSRRTPFADRFEVATGPEEARRLAEEAAAAGHPHRLVVCDLRLGTATGWDVVEELRSEGPPRTYVILTGSSDEEDMARTHELGCEHIVKPLTLAEWRALAAHLADLADDARS